jgi:ATP-dependent helicase/nuclease subunit A
MSAVEPRLELADLTDRERAVTTFDRSVVVTAGAGTGKTTLLVDRLVHLLARNPEPLKITEIVALTFTNKAANEMKQRLRERLQNYLDAIASNSPATAAEQKTEAAITALTERYQLSRDELQARLHEALRNIERAEIGTIHSFAATLLRLYPLEAGVDPQFREDDGRQFEALFAEQWSLWLDQELALNATHADEWRKILRKLNLEQVKSLAQSLAAESVELSRPPAKPGAWPPALALWLEQLSLRAAALIERHPEDRQNEKLARAAGAVMDAFLRDRRLAEDALTDERLLLADAHVNANLRGWTEADVAEARVLVRAAKGLGRVDEHLTELLWSLLAPFAERFRRFFVEQGFVSFDGLLMGARNLVRDQPRVREELKRKYRSILIDEFQDTDPIQYEILLYLAERFGAAAKDWRAVKLTPGKVFVVGDPKQSIYAFRRADIAAYLEVIEKIIKAQDGADCRLTTNFRSDPEILGVVNAIFGTLMQAQEGLQPPYIPIQPAPERLAAAARTPAAPALARVALRKIVHDGSDLDAETARRLEAESLARWLKDEVLHKALIHQGGNAVVAQPKDIAILFRKLTDIHEYLEPFRRRDIRYVVEGERHFYAAKEIIDAVNLLRAIDNPHDRVALVGVLRSPLGGAPDKLIYDLHCRGLLDYRKAAQLRDSDLLDRLAELYRVLARLHDETRLVPLGEAVALIFASLPVRLLAACYFHGEQAVANLDKLKQQVETLGREGLTTLKEAVRQLQERVLDVREEGESVLAEETVDAVRIMSIHKAKGLEFPVVILAGCHAGIDGRQGKTAEVLFDWSSGLSGVRVGPYWDMPGLYIAEKMRLRSEEEHKRVLYVAMTRPRDHLVISCAPALRRSSGSFSAMIGQTLGLEVDAVSACQRMPVGSAELEIELVVENLAAPGRLESAANRAGKKRNWRPFLDRWTRRHHAFEIASRSPVFLTPTLLKQREQELSEAPEAIEPKAGASTPPLILGDLAHKFLRDWNFDDDPSAFRAPLKAFVLRALAHEQRQPLPAIQRELEEILAPFFGSKVYAELGAARILGREVPLLLPWDGNIMEGVIDLIFERNGLLYLADYKTDRVSPADLARHARVYHQQAEIYTRGAQEGLRRSVAAFKLIFLRLGEALEVRLAPAQGELFG